MIKLETDVDIQSEEDPIDMLTEEVHIPSPFSVKAEELKVSHVFSHCHESEGEGENVCIFAREDVRIEKANIFYLLKHSVTLVTYRGV